MGPYTKAKTATVIDDGWEIEDGDGNVIAILDTETMANVLMQHLHTDDHDEAWLTEWRRNLKPGDFVRIAPDGAGTWDVTIRMIWWASDRWTIVGEDGVRIEGHISELQVP